MNMKGFYLITKYIIFPLAGLCVFITGVLAVIADGDGSHFIENYTLMGIGLVLLKPSGSE